MQAGAHPGSAGAPSNLDQVIWLVPRFQAAAEHNLGITQPRVSDLLRGKISKFSLDALINIAARVGLHTELGISADTEHPLPS